MFTVLECQAVSTELNPIELVAAPVKQPRIVMDVPAAPK